MVSRELLKENFDELEITPSDAILDKCTTVMKFWFGKFGCEYV